MGCQKEVDGIAVKDSTARKILLAIRENYNSVGLGQPLAL